MVRLPVDERDVDRSSPQRLRGGQAAEAAPTITTWWRAVTAASLAC
jgi:hypothetical protein